MSSFGRSRLKENPVPPPDWWIFAIAPSVRKMPSMESSTGRTKHAASWPSPVPAFMSAGEFGRNSREASASKNSRSMRAASASPPHASSAPATARATRRNISLGVSHTRPSSSRLR